MSKQHNMRTKQTNSVQVGLKKRNLIVGGGLFFMALAVGPFLFKKNDTSAITWGKIQVSASQSAQGGIISWQVDQEQNTSHFVVERSDFEDNFIEIGKVELESNHIYEYLDDELIHIEMPAANYRIKQVGLDGESRFSETVQYSKNLGNGLYLKVEKAETGQTKFLFAGDEDVIATLSILDPSGRAIVYKNLNVKREAQRGELRDPALKTGNYYVHMTSDEFTTIQKLVIP